MFDNAIGAQHAGRSKLPDRGRCWTCDRETGRPRILWALRAMVNGGFVSRFFQAAVLTSKGGLLALVTHRRHGQLNGADPH